MTYIVGVDIGGTFTDVAAISTATGATYTTKARTTPWDLIEGLVEGLGLVAEQMGLTTEELLANTEKFAHGTTQTSNVSAPPEHPFGTVHETKADAMAAKGGGY